MKNDRKTLRGAGRISKQEAILSPVQYTHTTIQSYDEVGTFDGMCRVPTCAEVHVRISPASALAGYFGELLTLHMDDGRKQNIYASSSDGMCRGTGGPY
jgi:hypothetical protein